MPTRSISTTGSRSPGSSLERRAQHPGRQRLLGRPVGALLHQRRRHAHARDRCRRNLSFDVSSAGRLRTSVGFNYNETEIRNIADNPPELAGLNLTLFDRRTRGWYTESPKTKLILGANFETGPLTIDAKGTRYDSFRILDNNPANDQSFGAKSVTDLEVSYGITDKLRLAAGAYNIFDVYPDRTAVTNTIGLAPYGAGPFGHYGGYYYGRVSLDF